MKHFVFRYFQELFQNWKLAFHTRKFTYTILATILFFLPFVFFLESFFIFIENRNGCVLNDFILNFLPAINLSSIIFIIIYSSIISVLFYAIRFPWLFIRGCQLFLLVHYIRNVCLFLTPLDPPNDIIVLQDPFLQLFIYNEVHPNTKDLFFSGHTATVYIFMLLLWNRLQFKLIFGCLTILMAALLLFQHCHYSIDIIGALACTYLAYRMILYIWLKLKLPID
ncbi:MAG: hypothetical protein IPO16_11875 [Saprospiraceae bacterium]|nr:hypothetical protein [Saprospiraceae bacterium]